MEGNVKDLNDEITHKDLYNKFELVNKDLENINKGILRIEKANQDQIDTYVTKDQFSPVRNITYGMVGVILIAVIGAVLGTVITKTNADSTPATIINATK